MGILRKRNILKFGGSWWCLPLGSFTGDSTLYRAPTTCSFAEGCESSHRYSQAAPSGAERRDLSLFRRVLLYMFPESLRYGERTYLWHHPINRRKYKGSFGYKSEGHIALPYCTTVVRRITRTSSSMKIGLGTLVPDKITREVLFVERRSKTASWLFLWSFSGAL